MNREVKRSFLLLEFLDLGSFADSTKSYGHRTPYRAVEQKNKVSLSENLKRIESLRWSLLGPELNVLVVRLALPQYLCYLFPYSEQFIEIFDILFSARSPLVHNEVLFANKMHCLLPVLRFDLSTPGFGE